MNCVSYLLKTEKKFARLQTKMDIIEYREKHQKSTQQEIADFFTSLFGVDVKRRTVGDLIAIKETFQDFDDNDDGGTPRKRHRSAMHSDMESVHEMFIL